MAVLPPHGPHNAGPKLPMQAAQFPRENGRRPEDASGEEKSGDAITVNTTRHPVQPVNIKKQLPGKGVARKGGGAGVSRSTPRIGYSPEGSRTPVSKASGYGSAAPSPYTDPRAAKRMRSSPVNGVDISQRETPSMEPRKEFSLRPTPKAHSKASKSGRPPSAHKASNSYTYNRGRPPARNGDISHGLRKSREDSGLENGLSRSQSRSTEDHIDAQLEAEQPRSQRNEEPATIKDEENCADDVFFIGPKLPYFSQGYKPPEMGHSRKETHPEPKPEPSPTAGIRTREAGASLHDTVPKTARSEPAPSIPASSNPSNEVNGVVHTQARFEILPKPSRRGRKPGLKERPNLSPTLQNRSDSDAPLIPKDLPARPATAAPASARTDMVVGQPRHEPSQVASTVSSESPPINGFASLNQGSSNLPESRHGQILGARERPNLIGSRRQIKLDDSCIYGKANEPFRPGSALFNKPWYEQPARAVRPATSFAYIDPRVHWSQPRTEQWYREKQDEIASRGNRKANLGRAYETAAQRKLEDQIADRRVQLPVRVETHRKWLQALDELDEIVDSNRLRLQAERRAKSTRRPPQNAREREPPSPSPMEDEDLEEGYADEEENGSPTKAKKDRQRKGKGKAKAVFITVDDSEDDDFYADEHMDVDSDS